MELKNDIAGALFNDIEQLIPTIGNIDVVFFTGDIVNSGSQNEYITFETFLQKLWRCFDTLGQRPRLIAVPGNHDLIRNDNSMVDIMTTWEKEKESFLREYHTDYQGCTFARTFSNYIDWWNNKKWDTNQYKPAGIDIGVFPGDFTYSYITPGQLRIGIMGLNSTFLQQRKDKFLGELQLDPRQFYYACGGDLGQWVKQHDLRILLTHHPPSWLKNIKEFNEQKTNADIDLHLCGHLHSPHPYWELSSSTRIWQGRSLFGVDTVTDDESDT